MATALAPTQTETSRWRPRIDLTSLVPELEMLYDTVFHGESQLGSGASMHESDEAFMLDFDLPGVTKQDITIDLTGQRLCVHGHRTQVDRKGIRRQSTRSEADFTYDIGLPTAVDQAKSTATLSMGVLSIRLPKAANAKSTHIRIT